MAPHIYTPLHKEVALVSEGIFTYCFPKNDKFSPDSLLYIDGITGKKITRGELKDLSLQVGYGMKRRGLNRGDTVMIFCSNAISWPMTMFGAVAAGLRITFANTAYTPAELAHQYTDSQASTIFVHPALVPVTLKMLQGLGVNAEEARKRLVVMSWGENVRQEAGFAQLGEFLGQGRLNEEEKFSGNQVHETAYLCYSSGTTGKSKGVETTVHNVTSVLGMIDPAFPDISPQRDSMIGVLPMYHIFGLIYLLHLPITRNIPCIIVPRFEPVEFCATIARYKITVAFIVPPILVVLASHPAPEKHDVSSLKMLLSGAAPLRAPLVEAVKKRFQKLGGEVDVSQGYGLTETSPTTHVLDPRRSIDKMGSCGLMLPNLEARLVETDSEDPAKVKDAKLGGPGELWLRGPNIMKGYLNNVQASKNALTDDQWFKTGDIATVDSEGFFYIVDRQKELIKYKGFQVPPADLESLLLTHPKIVDAGVIGIESAAQATELPRAYVVPVGGLASLKDPKLQAAFCKEVQKWVESKVAKHKYLRGGVVVIDAIPKSAAGKILRKDLRELAKKEMTEGGARAKL